MLQLRIVRPGARRLRPAAAGVPPRRIVALGLGFAPAGPQAIDDLVAQDADQPGALAGVAAAGGLAAQGGEQGFLHRILGIGALAQAQHREAVEVGGVRRDPAVEVGEERGSRLHAR